MDHWKEEWADWCARVEGLAAAVGVQDLESSRGSIIQYLDSQCEECFVDLKSFFGRHPELKGAGSRFAAFTAARGTTSNPQGLKPRIRVAFLLALRSELSWHLRDADLRLSHAAERGFLHLQRLIVADPEVRAKWTAAFNDNEPACERLGGAHLLHHGIWAFKAHSDGGRTDLVLGKPLQVTEMERRALTGLVLTEWKRPTSDGEVATMAAAARRQAEAYTQGLLAGFELASIRYIVLVTPRQAQPIGDVEENGRIYRHINIAVDPLTPSKI